MSNTIQQFGYEDIDANIGEFHLSAADEAEQNATTLDAMTDELEAHYARVDRRHRREREMGLIAREMATKR